MDNASYYRVGLIPWSEMDRAYPADTPGLIRCGPIPRPAFLLLKDPTGFRSRLPRLTALCLRLELVAGRLVICDGLMAVTSDEFVRRLNDYQGTHAGQNGLA